MKSKNKYLTWLLPFRCIAFFLIFIIGASFVNKKVDEISNWWVTVHCIEVLPWPSK